MILFLKSITRESDNLSQDVTGDDDNNEENQRANQALHRIPMYIGTAELKRYPTESSLSWRF
jgi:hypothetical protein